LSVTRSDSVQNGNGKFSVVNGEQEILNKSLLTIGAGYYRMT